VKSPDPPKPVDPYEVARADAEFNRIDQYTPYGNLTYSGPNRNTATLNLDPRVQGLLDSQISSDQNMLAMALERQGMLNPNPIDLSQFGDIQTDLGMTPQWANPDFGNLPQLNRPEFLSVNGIRPFSEGVSPWSLPDAPGLQRALDVGGLPQIPQDIEQFRGDVTQSVFNRGRELLDPMYADRERALAQQMANQGLPRFDEAESKEFDRFNQSRERAYNDLANQAVITGGSEASRALGDVLAARGQGFGESLAGGQFANNAGLSEFGAGLQRAGLGFGQQLGAGEFQNQSALADLNARLAQTGYNNQLGLMGLGADQSIRDMLGREGITSADYANQAQANNLQFAQQNMNNLNQARAQSLAESLGIRGNQFNEMAALLGLQQVQQPGLNSFYAPSNVNTLGGYALNQQGQQANYQAQMANNQAMMGGLAGLGGAILGGPIGGAIGGSLFGGGGGQSSFNAYLDQMLGL